MSELQGGSSSPFFHEHFGASKFETYEFWSEGQKWSKHVKTRQCPSNPELCTLKHVYTCSLSSNMDKNDKVFDRLCPPQYHHLDLQTLH